MQYITIFRLCAILPKRAFTHEAPAGCAVRRAGSCDSGMTERSEDPGESAAESDYAAVSSFVRTSWTVRCNVVALWKPLPRGMWTLLRSSEDHVLSRKREQSCVIGVGVLAAMCISIALCLAPERSFGLILWASVPPLLGWFSVRRLWLPRVASSANREATLSFARHLGGMYLYVYLVIALGVLLMLLLVWVAPDQTGTLRYCISWCLFGESFFVPAVTWLRLVVNDTSSEVFGRARRSMSAGYLILFVLVPSVGCVMQMLTIP